MAIMCLNMLILLQDRRAAVRLSAQGWDGDENLVTKTWLGDENTVQPFEV